ncbi:uncharacterized protein V3H82_018114 [Fundulus diaphanus]
MKNSLKPAKSKEKRSSAGSSKKVKTPEVESLEPVSSSSDLVKPEPLDQDFTAKKKGLKRKRVKEEPAEEAAQLTVSSTLPVQQRKRHLSGEAEGEGEAEKKKAQKKREKVNVFL